MEFHSGVSVYLSFVGENSELFSFRFFFKSGGLKQARDINIMIYGKNPYFKKCFFFVILFFFSKTTGR